ncbi:MAG: HAD family phosphatase [Lachnospiraceae bacterium]|nr:HAD family phosphatase [Lachnospiraceae bacterium]
MIQNLIFDVGSVLIGYRWKEMLTLDFGIEESHAEELGHRLFEDPIWKYYDRGVVDTDELTDHYCRLYPDDSATIKRMILEGERMMVPRDTLWKRIEERKEQGFKIFILSNYSKFLFEKHTEPIPFMNTLDGMVISYEVHMLKPESGIYEHLLKKYSLVPEECLFFDDRLENVEAAEKMGIHSVQVTSEDMLIRELEKLK